MLLLYARAMHHRADGSHATSRIYAMAGGYVATWALFSVGATALQRWFASLFLMTPMMEPSSPRVAAALLLVAAAYQLTPFKTACLHLCRSPMAMLSTRWREGVGGAFQMGFTHGLYCLGCCWALMLVLFAGGVMNLAVIVTLTVWVAIEKLAPFGKQSARVGAALLACAGVWMLTR
jgi:predicted metal-binding membrane protein